MRGGGVGPVTIYSVYRRDSLDVSWRSGDSLSSYWRRICINFASSHLSYVSLFLSKRRNCMPPVSIVISSTLSILSSEICMHISPVK